MPDYYDIEYAPEYQERRSAYRVLPSQPLSAWMYAQGAEPASGHVMEMSGQGMGIAAPTQTLAWFQEDQVIELSIGSNQNDRIVTPARIVSARPIDQDWARYGVFFINVGDLHEQLDMFFQAHFNRRGGERAKPLPNDVVRVQARWSGGQLTARVHDLSTTGMSMSISPLSTVILKPGMELQVQFRLPGAVRSVSGKAQVRYVAELTRNRLIGVRFDLEDPRGVIRDMALIQAFVNQALGRVQAWEQSWTS